MLTFLDSRLIIFDVEVSDVDEARANGVVPEIIDVGAIKVTSDLTVVERFNSLVKPRNLELVTEHTTHLTGISVKMLEDSKPWEQLWESFLEFTENGRLAAFHAHNDYLWLRNAYTRSMLGFPHPNFVFDIASWVYGFCSWYGMKPTKGWGLKSCCDRFGVPHTQRHRGLADAEAALGLLSEIQRIEHEYESKCQPRSGGIS